MVKKVNVVLYIIVKRKGIDFKGKPYVKGTVPRETSIVHMNKGQM